MDEDSPGHTLATKQDLRDLKEDLRLEFGRSFDAINWKIVAVGVVNVGGLVTGLAALLNRPATSSAIHAIGKVVGF